MGDYSYSYNIAYYFGMFATLGMLRYGTRSIAAKRESEHDKNKLFWELMSVQLITGAVVMLLYLAYSAATSSVLAYIWIPYVLSTALDVSWLFRGDEDFKTTVVRNSIVKIATAVCIFAFVKNEEDVYLYALIMALGYLTTQLLLWPCLRRHISGFVRPTSLRAIARHFLPNVLLFLPLAATSIYRVFDKVLIGMLSDSAQLGFFDCADKIVMVPLGIISALGAVMLPRMAYLISFGNERRGISILRQTMSLSMIISSCLMFGILAVGDLFSVIYFGAAYEETGVLLRLLSVTVPMIAWASVLREQYLIPKKMDRQYIASVVAGAVFNLSANYFAIPLWGARGAALVTIVTELIVAAMLTFSSRRRLPLCQYAIDSAPYFAIGFLMFALMATIRLIVPLQGICLLLALMVFGLALYLLLLCCLSKISGRHRMIMRMLLLSKE